MKFLLKAKAKKFANLQCVCKFPNSPVETKYFK